MMVPFGANIIEITLVMESSQIGIVLTDISFIRIFLISISLVVLNGGFVSTIPKFIFFGFPVS